MCAYFNPRQLLESTGDSLDLQFVPPFTAIKMNAEILTAARLPRDLMASGPTFYVRVRTLSNNVRHAVNVVVQERKDLREKTPSAERENVGMLPKLDTLDFAVLQKAVFTNRFYVQALTLAMGGPTKCPESALTVSDFAFLWATVIKSYGRSDEKQTTIYTTALKILSEVTNSEALRGAIWGVDLQQKEPAVEKIKAKGKGKANKTVPAPAREEACPPTPARQGSV